MFSAHRGGREIQVERMRGKEKERSMIRESTFLAKCDEYHRARYFPAVVDYLAETINPLESTNILFLGASLTHSQSPL